MTNKTRGRTASSSQRNALNHFYSLAISLCQWLNVPESLRQPLKDWQERERGLLERATRLARRERTQQQVIINSTMEVSALDEIEILTPSWKTSQQWASDLSLEGTPIPFQLHFLNV